MCMLDSKYMAEITDKESIAIPASNRQTHSSTLILYKYLTPIALKGLIKNGDFRISTSDDVNDPFELKPKRADVNIKSCLPLGFLSLTASPVGPAMWGNYADKYQGACVELTIPYISWGKYQDSKQASLLSAMSKFLNREGISCYVFHNEETDNRENYDVSLKILFSGICALKCQYLSTRKEFKKLGELNNPTNKSNVDKIISSWVKACRLAIAKNILWSYEDEYRVPILLSNASRTEFVNDKILCFTNKLTKYISRIIVSPRATYNAQTVKAAIKCSSTPLSESIEVITANFSSTEFGFENLSLPSQVIYHNAKASILAHIEEINKLANSTGLTGDVLTMLKQSTEELKKIIKNQK